MVEKNDLEALAKLVRYYILMMTTEAGSGHPTSSLSATDLMVELFFEGHYRFDLKDPGNPANDRVIFSKGHASPLVYALYAAAGVISEKELLTYRKFGSELEGHPTPNFKYVDVATGSLGQGLAVGVGMAVAIARGPVSSFLPASARADKLVPKVGDSRSHALRAVGNPSTTATPRDFPKVYVLMGDGETAEGSVWEAAEIASYYKLGNLVAIVDVNRLGQSTETMLGWDVEKYKERFEAFGWEAQVIDGHNFDQIDEAFGMTVEGNPQKPKVIIAKTVKGKGVSFLEDNEGWHGKALDKEQFDAAVDELGKIDKSVRGEVIKPEFKVQNGFTFPYGKAKFKITDQNLKVEYKIGEEVATRKAYGETLLQLARLNPRIVALDGETSNSTFSELVKKEVPNQYLEMFIAEQNMAGVALGLSKRGFVPFASTFAAFWTRAHDQVRMSAYSQGDVKYVGSHSGVSIGEDGPSQMGLEDFALFKSVFGSTVLCPSDAVSCARLVVEAVGLGGVVYIRTARAATRVIYSPEENFEVGGSKVLRSTKDDKLTIVSCGVCVQEAMDAVEELSYAGINIRVVDAYSIKPVDEKTLKECAIETGNLVMTVEDHYFDGGLGDSVLNVFANGSAKVFKMAVSKMPMSGKPAELLNYEGIDSDSIVGVVKKILG